MDAATPRELADRIAERVGPHRPLIALDHDGTLSPIAPRPEDARLAPGARAAVMRLCAVADVVIISGRGLDDLSRRFSGLPVALVTEHGLRHRSAAGDVTWLTEGLPSTLLQQLRSRIDETLRDHAYPPGWIVEEKDVGLAVHFRLVPPEQREPLLHQIRSLFAEIATVGGVVQTGKAVIEIRASGATKGTALQQLLHDHPTGIPVMIGDDATDESALLVAEEHGGMGVLVAASARPTAASTRVEDPAAVVELLENLAELLSQG